MVICTSIQWNYHKTSYARKLIEDKELIDRIKIRVID